MSLTRADVERVAHLARLQLTPSELETMTAQLGKILHYVDQLGELDTAGVEPMAHAFEIANVFASDLLATSLPREAVLGNAPKRDDECYRVPAVLGE